jgi:hypothetical protein
MTKGSFFQAFNSSLPDFEKVFGEEWILVKGSNPGLYQAIFIETLSISSPKRMKGGKFVDCNTSLDIATCVFNESGVKRDDIIKVGHQQLRVMEMEFDGIDDVTLICGPAQVDVKAF